MKSAIYTSRIGLNHLTGPGHPECPERLKTLLELFAHDQMFHDVPLIEADAAEDEWILVAHNQRYMEFLEDHQPDNGFFYIDGDTLMSPDSLHAAYHATGAGCQAVRDVLKGTYEHAFCCVRPPGHHAPAAQAMGFCFFNNVFVAAKYAQNQMKAQKVVILDFDVHHGNGTADLVRSNNVENIFYISTHQMPLFPGTGDPEGNIPSKILDIPLQAGTNGKTFREKYETLVFPAIEEFKPDILLVSAGFDAHQDDPLAQINLEDNDFEWLGKEIIGLCQKLSCPSVSFLEGGYNLEALQRSVKGYLQGLFKL